MFEELGFNGLLIDKSVELKSSTTEPTMIKDQIWRGLDDAMQPGGGLQAFGSA